MKTGLQDYGTTGLRTTDYGLRTAGPVSGFTVHVSRSNPSSVAALRRVDAPTLQRRRAFTLLELLTVIAIMGIIAAIALPTLKSLKPNSAATASRQLLDAVSHARQLAISQRTTVYMVFVPPNFWSDPAYNYATWTTNDQNVVNSLLDKQLTSYAYVALRSVGDQPGASYPRYLSPWRTLTPGAYIPMEKFPGFNPLTPPPVVFRIMTNGISAYTVYAFNTTTSVPFPTETTPKLSTARPYVTLPYIAFDGMGQLVSGSGTQPEYIPISEGTVTYARDPASKQALAQLPTVRDAPPGNTTNNFNLVYVDQLTGRAHIEHMKVQ